VVVLAVVLALRRGPGVWQVLARSPVRAGGVGLLTGAYQGLYFVSVVAVGVTVSTVVSLGLAPVLLTGVTSLGTRTAPSPRAAAVVVAALAGLVLVAGSSGAGITGPHPLLGILTALGSGTAFAAATALEEPLARAADPLAIAAVTTTVATLGLAPLALGTAAIGGSAVVTTDPAALLILLYLGAITMALAYGLLDRGSGDPARTRHCRCHGRTVPRRSASPRRGRRQPAHPARLGRFSSPEPSHPRKHQVAVLGDAHEVGANAGFARSRSRPWSIGTGLGWAPGADQSQSRRRSSSRSTAASRRIPASVPRLSSR